MSRVQACHHFHHPSLAGTLPFWHLHLISHVVLDLSGLMIKLLSRSDCLSQVNLEMGLSDHPWFLTFIIIITNLSVKQETVFIKGF